MLGIGSGNLCWGNGAKRQGWVGKVKWGKKRSLVELQDLHRRAMAYLHWQETWVVKEVKTECERW